MQKKPLTCQLLTVYFFIYFRSIFWSLNGLLKKPSNYTVTHNCPISVFKSSNSGACRLSGVCFVLWGFLYTNVTFFCLSLSANLRPTQSLCTLKRSGRLTRSPTHWLQCPTAMTSLLSLNWMPPPYSGQTAWSPG